MYENQIISLESEAGFKALFKYATVGILVISADGRIQLANPSIEKIFGYINSELVGKPIEILIPEAFAEQHVLHRDAYFRSPKARPMGYGLDLFARKKNGIEFPVEISLGHYQLGSEKLAVAFVTDISNRKKTEKALFENKTRLDEETRALKLMHDSGNRLWQLEKLKEGLEEILATVLSIAKTSKGNIQLFDAAKTCLYIAVYKGFDQEFLDHYSEVTADSDSACGRALKEGGPVIIADTLQEWKDKEAALATRNGFRSVLSVPIIGQDGIPIGMISTHFKDPGRPGETTLNLVEVYVQKARSFIEKIRTVDTIKNYNRELEEKVNERTRELIYSLEREKDLNQMKSLFVSMASHEFRTPLTTILSSVSLIESYSRDDVNDKRLKHTQRIKSSVQNLVNILNDFLSLDKLEQGKIEVLYNKFNLFEFAEETIEEMKGMLKNGQQIRLLYTGLNEVVQDKKILRNIILNLLSNAIKYSHEMEEIEFNIDAGHSVQIVIRDKGIGIPEEQQARLFTKFFRGHNVAGIEGTGLGLTIVKRYVDLLNGKISFESRYNEGTSFNIVLPHSMNEDI